jgi:hypothetical protein
VAKYRSESMISRCTDGCVGSSMLPVPVIAIPLPRADTRQVAVPMKRPALAQRQPRLGAIVVEQTELDAAGVLGEQ